MATSSKNKGLGKGLSALLSTEGIPENTKDSVVDLKINDISPNEGQPRKTFDDDSLSELAASKHFRFWPDFSEWITMR